MQNMKLLVGVILGTLLLIVGAGWFFSLQTNQIEQNADQVVAEDVLIPEGAHVKGATESARFTIVEFSDFQCPGCAAVYLPVKSIVDQYKADVKFIYRHFPLNSIHANAAAAARAAESASLQGKFWEMHDLLFATQKQWGKEKDPTQAFVDLAKQIGLEEQAFRDGLTNPDIAARVNTDLQTALQLKLPGTPSFYLNGKLTDLSEIEETLRTELSGTVPQAEN